MLEARVILALFLSKYNFEKVGLDGVNDREVYNVILVYPLALLSS